jgi:hypothetical protein
MRTKGLALVSIALAFTATALAQDVTPKYEIFLDYTYLQFNEAVPGFHAKAFNGGGGGVQVNFGHHFGIKADLQGYASDTWTGTISATPVVTPHGTIPIGTYSSSANMFTWMFGPTVGTHLGRLNVYGETLFGGSNSNGYVDLVKAIDANGGTINLSGAQHPFTMAAGGGFDLRVSHHLTVRLAEFDYVLTRYTNPIVASTNNQNNWRYLGGLVFTFGGE